MRLDIGIASYQNPDKLDKTLDALAKNTTKDWRCLIVDNASPDPAVREVIERHVAQNGRFIPLFLDENIGYSGAVNKIFDWAETEFVAYCDNDARVKTPAWNEIFVDTFQKSSEIAMVFGHGVGAGAAYPIKRAGWTEVLWGIGCFWMMRRSAQQEVGYFDTSLGHQDEVDYQTRLRMAGWKMALDSRVELSHSQTASRSPEALERINAGIINWVNKWCEIFTGKLVNYHSANVIRFEDWPPNALYLEEFYLQTLPNLNDNPEQVIIDGREYDLNRVPRAAYGGGTMYRGRII